jgi:hypothetical protein
MIELLADGDVRLSHAHKTVVRGPVTASEQRLVLRIASNFYDELMELWDASQP